MALPIRRTRRRKAIAARRRFLAGIGVVALAIAALATTLTPRAEPDRSELGSVAAASLTGDSAVLLNASIPTGPQRAVFPYSVVPGGVNSVDELRRSMQGDAVVAEHYKDFDLSKARVERLAIPRFAHVSYRLGDHVYWTRKALVLPAGERVITDGKNVARTRCGNRLADRPGATSPAEPAADVLNAPSGSRPSQITSSIPTPLLASRMSPSLTGTVGSGGGAGGGSGPIPSTAPGGFVSGGGGAAAGTGHSSGTASNEPCAAASPCASDVPPGPGAGNGPGTPHDGAVPPPSGSTPPSNGPPLLTNPPSGTVPPDIPLGPHNPPGGDEPHTGTTPPGGDGPLGPGDVPPGLGTDPSQPQDVPTPVPEPSSIMLLLTAAGGLLARHGRKHLASAFRRKISR